MPEMKLWFISQKVNDGYDTFDSAVVAAESETEARSIHPDGRKREYCVSSWTRKENITVDYIGTAKEGTERGVIVASFNAG